MSHDLLKALAIFAVGLAAGTINTVVGSGTLITFPTLLAFGYPPVLANVSNNVGLVPGVASGVYGYRAELAGQRRRVIRLGSASLCGGLLGAILLLVLPAGAFKAIVPVLIGIALLMVVFQPRLARWVAARQRARAPVPGDPGAADPGVADPGVVGPGLVDPGVVGPGMVGPGMVRAAGAAGTEADPQLGGPVLWVLVFLSGIYGGYFGAAQGVLLIGLMGVAFTDSMQRINAVKNVLAGLVNGIAAVVFVIATHIDWGAAGLIAAGAILGGQLGARIGRKLPPWALRVLIICVGVAALVKLLV
ncbi:MAG TPA: sulfite exporter TauE/SafE family protein [Trebonia sp.]